MSETVDFVVYLSIGIFLLVNLFLSLEYRKNLILVLCSLVVSIGSIFLLIEIIGKRAIEKFVPIKPRIGFVSNDSMALEYTIESRVINDSTNRFALIEHYIDSIPNYFIVYPITSIKLNDDDSVNSYVTKHKHWGNYILSGGISAIRTELKNDSTIIIPSIKSRIDPSASVKRIVDNYSTSSQINKFTSFDSIYKIHIDSIVDVFAMDLLIESRSVTTHKAYGLAIDPSGFDSKVKVDKWSIYNVNREISIDSILNTLKIDNYIYAIPFVSDSIKSYLYSDTGKGSLDKIKLRKKHNDNKIGFIIQYNK